MSVHTANLLSILQFHFKLENDPTIDTNISHVRVSNGLLSGFSMSFTKYLMVELYENTIIVHIENSMYEFAIAMTDRIVDDYLTAIQRGLREYNVDLRNPSDCQIDIEKILGATLTSVMVQWGLVEKTTKTVYTLP